MPLFLENTIPENAYVVDETTTTTTATTFPGATKVTLNFTPSADGVYQLTTVAQLGSSAANTSPSIRLFDGTTAYDNSTFRVSATVANNAWQQWAGMHQLTLVGGTAYAFEVQYMGPNTTSCKNCTLAIQRIS